MAKYVQPVAGVQYDDMKGTCAADFSETSSDFLKSIGFNEIGRFVLNIECFSNHGSDFSVTVSFVNAGSYDEAQEALSLGKEILKDEVTVTHESFFKHFKRFSMVLGRKGLPS